jgi:hypothetical protein
MNLLIDIMGALVGLAFALIALGAATDYIARIIIN